MKQPLVGIVKVSVIVGAHGVGLLLLAGCGYTTRSSLDPMYQTIAISPFYSKSVEYDLDAPLTNAVVRKFITDSRLKVMSPEDADLLLEGVILDMHRKGLMHDKDDNVTQAVLVITAAARLTDLKTGKVLWEEPVLAGETSFSTKSSGMTSDRLRGNAEAYMITVRSFATEEENQAATEALEQLASDIFHRVVEPW